MSIGISTIQTSAPNSLNSGTDSNLSNPASEEDSQTFSKLMNAGSSNADGIIQGEQGLPDMGQSKVGFSYSWSDFGTAVLDGIMCKPYIPDSLRCTAQTITNILDKSNTFNNLPSDLKDGIAQLIVNLANGDGSPKPLIEGALNSVVDDSSIPEDKKTSLKNLINGLVDAAATAAFIASLPESFEAVLSDDPSEAAEAVNDLKNQAEDWIGKM